MTCDVFSDSKAHNSYSIPTTLSLCTTNHQVSALFTASQDNRGVMGDGIIRWGIRAGCETVESCSFKQEVRMRIFKLLSFCLARPDCQAKYWRVYCSHFQPSCLDNGNGNHEDFQALTHAVVFILPYHSWTHHCIIIINSTKWHNLNTYTKERKERYSYLICEEVRINR